MAGYDARYDNPLDPMSGGRPSPPETSQQDAYEYSKHGSSSGYLGQLPLGADSAQAETASALRTLFGEGADVQALQEPPNQINTLAEGAAVAETGGVLGGDTTRSDNEALAIDPSLSEQAAPAPKDSTETPDDRSRSPSSGNHHHQHHPAVKRKATSRAGMLARGGACEFCKRRKLKCSAELPACANCVKSGKECVYAQKKQRSRVKVLEDRLQELEKRLEQGQAGGTAVGDSGVHAASSVYTAPSLGSGGGSELTVEQTLVHNVDPSLLPPSEYDEAFILHDFDSFADMRKQETQLEPDLMTLADAAAADTPAAAETNDPWAQMSPEEIVKEIIKVATGGKGEGERIISHLYVYFVSTSKLYLTRKKSANVHELDCQHVAPARHPADGSRQPRVPHDGGPYPPHPPPLAHPRSAPSIAYPIAPPSRHPAPPPPARARPLCAGHHAIRPPRARHHHRRRVACVQLLQRGEEH